MSYTNLRKKFYKCYRLYGAPSQHFPFQTLPLMKVYCKGLLSPNRRHSQIYWHSHNVCDVKSQGGTQHYQPQLKDAKRKM